MSDTPQYVPPSSGQLGDPFSAAASTQPGFLGQSPAFWQHLAMFGGNLAASANARTPSGHLAYGTGFGGPFGAAIGATAEQAQAQAANQSRIGLQQQQTQGQQLQNRLTASELPLTEARNNMLMGVYQDPNLINSIRQAASGSAAPAPYGGTSPYGDATPPPAPQAGGLGPVVQQLESGGRGNTPGIVGDGGAAGGPMQVHQGAIDDFNKAHGTTYTLATAIDNPGVSNQVGNWYLNKQVQQFGPRMGLAAYNAGPGRVTQAIQSGAGMAALPASTQDYTNRGMQLYNGIDPSSGILRANQLMQQAAAVEAAKSLGIPGVLGDPTILRQMAQDNMHMALAAPTAGSSKRAELQEQLQLQPQIAGATKQAEANVDLQTAGPIQAQKSANSNVDIRAGGAAGLVDPTTGKRTWFKNPEKEQIVDPATGQKITGHMAPAPPDAPPGTPGTFEPVLGADGKPIVTGIAPNVQDARNKAYTEFAGKDTDTFQAATNTQGILAQMNEAARVLNQNGGMLGTGPTAPARIALASKVNDILRTAGLPAAFDPNAVGSWEELTKATKTAGFELSSHYEGHARQAAQTIENATSAVPGEMNTPIGFAKVFAGINEQAQMGMDLHNTKLPVYNSGGDIVNAETNFINKFPAQMYSRRAISTVTPYPISSDKELSRYLPGTFVTYKGNVVQVPARPDAPPIPDYIHEMHQPQPGAPQQ